MSRWWTLLLAGRYWLSCGGKRSLEDCFAPRTGHCGSDGSALDFFQTIKPSSEFSPIVRLVFCLVRDNRRVDKLSRTSHELDVAAFLTGLDKTYRLEPSLDFAEGLRLKLSQPQPQSRVLWAGESLAEVRNGVRALPLLFLPGWQHRFRDIGKRTSFLHAKRMRQRDVS